jgi:hypothetical protein
MIRFSVLSSAASLALATILILSGPAFAQLGATTDPDFNTRALNAAAANEAAAAARVQAAEQHDRVRDYQEGLREHDQAIARTEAVQNAQADAYQRELETYVAEKERHERDLRVYKEVLANLDEKNFAILPYPDQKLSELSLLSDAELVGVVVHDRDGKFVGKVANVDIPRVAVKLNTGPTVVVRSPRLRYDLDTHVVIADVKVSDLEKFPPAAF